MPSPEERALEPWPPRGGRLPAWWIVVAALALATLSTLAGWALAFDAEAWLVWGRDLLRGDFDTAGGPSWKPLPVLFTAPFALVPDAAPLLWLVVARAGGLLALAGAWALAARLVGRPAGAAAAAVLALSPWWLLNVWLGNSEGLLAAAVLWAVVAHLDGHPRSALALALAAALVRPEIWPFFGLYWLYRWRVAPRDRSLLVAAAAVWAVGWLGPDVAGTGGAFGASDAALGPATPQSAANAAVPFAAVLWDAVEMVSPPAMVAALAAVVLAGRLARLLGAAAAAYVLVVAVATQAGYAGNPRYLVPAAAIGAVLAGAGAVEAARRAARTPRAPTAAAVALVAVVALAETGSHGDTLDELSWRGAHRQALDRLVDGAGGASALRRCGAVRTRTDRRTLVARRLDVRLPGLTEKPAAPGLLLRAGSRGTDDLAPPQPPSPFTLTARESGWELWTACG